MKQPRRVVIADDHPLVRDGLKALLTRRTLVIGEARDGAEVVSVVAEQRPDVVIMDLQMPEMSGIEATTAISTPL